MREWLTIIGSELINAFKEVDKMKQKGKLTNLDNKKTKGGDDFWVATFTSVDNVSTTLSVFDRKLFECLEVGKWFNYDFKEVGDYKNMSWVTDGTSEEIIKQTPEPIKEDLLVEAKKIVNDLISPDDFLTGKYVEVWKVLYEQRKLDERTERIAELRK